MHAKGSTVASHIFIEARADATMAADILTYLRDNPGREHTARQVSDHLPSRYPLGALQACLDTLYRNRHLTRRKTSRGRYYTTTPTGQQR
jgi:hypothetical protein